MEFCNPRRKGRTLPLIPLLFSLLFSGAAGSCTGASGFPAAPTVPEEDDEAKGFWADVLAADPSYPDNLYLARVVEFHPGPAGEARAVYTPLYYGPDRRPLPETAAGALGPPEGCYPVTESNQKALMAVMGAGGWAVWEFEAGRMVVDGPGADFVTFSNHNVLSGEPDGSWNELGRVYVSPDNINWYENQAASWDVNSSPGEPDSSYVWAHSAGLHGVHHTWANFRKETLAQVLDPGSGVYADVVDSEGAPVLISRYFSPDTPYLGGDSFDLSDFIHTETSQPWPAGEGVRYLKLADDPAILDGQDYKPEYMTGARLMSAMGIHTAEDEGGL